MIRISAKEADDIRELENKVKTSTSVASFSMAVTRQP